MSPPFPGEDTEAQEGQAQVHFPTAGRRREWGSNPGTPAPEPSAKRLLGMWVFSTSQLFWILSKVFIVKKIKTFKFPKGSNSTALPDSGSQTLRFHGPGKLGKVFSSQLNGDQLFILPS